MNLFRRKTASSHQNTSSQTAETIKKLREQLDTLEKREQHISTKISLQLQEAKKKAAAKDKRGAIFALKRKKMYENEIEKLQGARMTLETQIMTLESAHVNMETFNAMRSGAGQMKAIHGQISVDTVDNIMDDIQEEMATADEISRAISQPVGTELYDDDELEAELEAMEVLQVEEKRAIAETTVTNTPTATNIPPETAARALNTSTSTYTLPEPPTHAVEDRSELSLGAEDEAELEALRRLESSMAM